MCLLPRPRSLAGREDLLAGVHAMLSAHDAIGPRLLVVCGLGGVGKTSIATEYAHSQLAELAVAWHLQAEEPAALAAGFGDLAGQLGARTMLDAGNPVAQVHAALAAHPGGWLLIFDNAPSFAAIRRMLPPAGRGRVLVTSQDPHWPVGHTIEVPPLQTTVAAAFLQARTKTSDADAALDLAAELGGLPLALEQAAAYMLAVGRPISSYLALFRRRRHDLLLRGEPGGYGKQVATTWELAFEQLEQTTPQAITLLRLLACCAPDDIPLQLLAQSAPSVADTLPAPLAALLEDPLACDDAIAGLRHFSLVSSHDGTVSVHRLVQAVTLDQLPGSEAVTWRQAARSLVLAALPDDSAHPENWPAYAALLPHAEVALRPEDKGMERIADFIGRGKGNFIAARALCQRTVMASESVLGADHLDTLRARSTLAFLTGMAGDLVAAENQFAAVLQDKERILGPEHPETLMTRYGLARWTINDSTARNLHLTLLPSITRVLGPEHVYTLNTRANLARWLGIDGNRAAARDEYADILRTGEQSVGLEHAVTLGTRARLAHWTGEAGDAAAARDQYAALLPISERVLGADHPDTLYCRVRLAHWTGEAGDAAAARDQCAALLPISERVLGADHPDTLDARASLAEWGRRASGLAAASIVRLWSRCGARMLAGGVAGMSGDVLVALAQWAGQTVATAALTDVWESVRGRFARLLGRGDVRKTEVAERWLAQTREQLTAAAPGADLERLRDAQAERWTGRFADLLDEDPGLEAELRTLAEEIAARLPAGPVSASGHSVAGGRDVNITASGGGIAAGVIHGNVAPPDPTCPGPAIM
jgi:Tetratricopeptide repeat